MSKIDVANVSKLAQRSRGALRFNNQKELDALQNEDEVRKALIRLVMPVCIKAADRGKRSVGVRLTKADIGELPLDLKKNKLLKSMCLLLRIEGYAATLHTNIENQCILQVTWLFH